MCSAKALPKFGQDNNSKHNTKQNRLKKKNRGAMLQWVRKNSDPNLAEKLWQNFKRAIYKQIATKLNELKQCCIEERAKIPQQLHERMKNDYY